MKSDIDIKTEIRSLLIKSKLSSAITGSIRTRNRIVDSDNEDVVIKILGNNISQRQEAKVCVSVFVKAIYEKGQYSEDSKRLRELSSICLEVLNSIRDKEFKISFNEQRVIATKDERWYVINNTMFYQIINE